MRSAQQDALSPQVDTRLSEISLIASIVTGRAERELLAAVLSTDGSMFR